MEFLKPFRVIAAGAGVDPVVSAGYCFAGKLPPGEAV